MPLRPDILNPLFADAETLKGVGPRNAAALKGLTGPRVRDVALHLPSGCVDRRYEPRVIEAQDGAVATLRVRVDEHRPGRTRRQPYRVIVSDDSGAMTLTFFHAREDYLKKILPEGETRIISGRLEMYDNLMQMTHPDFVVEEKDRGDIPAIEPVHPLTAGVSRRVFARILAESLKAMPELPEWLDTHHRARESWPAWRDAVLAAHAPARPEDAEADAPVRRRLAYDELLANQLAVMLVRRARRAKAARGRETAGTGELREAVINALPYALTGAQKSAVEDILADMAAPARMLRLLQGDVGSGKTVVALLAMAAAAESGGQAAMMAPTEILARQHYTELSRLAAPAGLNVALLTGSEKGAARAATLAALASGETALCVGTHALFQEGVAFKDLMLAVIDEQHRFGVTQRLTLSEKGRAADILVTTATPIPRTLLLTEYGDMDVSRLHEKPPGRAPVKTSVLPTARLEDVTAAVKRETDAGGKVFWVCPLVEESETLDVTAAEQRHRALARAFGENAVGLVHGRMKTAEKDAVMTAFMDGPLKILVATTVIEVGVDVAAASVMVIEHAERFGLAQLHQLRGRVGRGARPSFCLMVYQPPLGDTAKARLKIMRETDDGFRIAEEDLRLRGGGEVLGTRQSGLPEFRLADLSRHQDLLETAQNDAKMILETDPDLQSPRGEALRALLYLFERDAAVKTLRSG
ncbi:MAG: ATP-dependent DNA helicase RecG [Rhodospirillales bacterium]